MRKAVICSLVAAALIAPPAVAHTSIGTMLRDASVDHDLDRIRINFLKAQRRIDAEDLSRANGKVDLTDPAQGAKRATSP
ncbi:hypothetical protein [Bradyrhizobium canariense]|uniref:hypothetical protein n=1 Tax=Bradyrhizobium canariense TaxID=255045 RepID=UPI000C24C399|nr:hypothetical protein [Bradyrhizobium canariense]